MGLFDGPTTTQTSTGTSGPSAMTQPYWDQYLKQMGQLTANGTVPVYGGQRVADMNGAQNTALDMGYNLATGGSPAQNMANAQITAQASGAITNPYATTQNPWEGQQNSFMGQTNPYAGDNPYLHQMASGVANDMASAYATGTAAQTDAAFNQGGAYGGSAYQNQTGINNKAFAGQLGNTLSNIYGQNYYNSGQLAQNDLNRNANISGQDLARNSGLADNTLNRATTAFQNQQQNALQAAGLGLQSGQMDWNAINNLNALGTQRQQNAQNVLNGNMDWWNQTAMGPYANLDIQGNALGRVPGMTTSSSGTSSGGGASPIANGIGAIGSLWSLGKAGFL
jgi:hypothetical protein